MVARSKAVLCLLWPIANSQSIANSVGLDEQDSHVNNCEDGTKCCRIPKTNEVGGLGYSYEYAPGEHWPATQTLEVTCKENYYSKNGSVPKATCAVEDGDEWHSNDFDPAPTWKFSGCESEKLTMAGVVYYTAPADKGEVVPSSWRKVWPENNTLADSDSIWKELRNYDVMYKRDGLRAVCVVNMTHEMLLFEAPHASDMHRRRLHGHDELASKALSTERTPGTERTREETLLKTACRDLFERTTATTTTTTPANMIDKTLPVSAATTSANVIDQTFPTERPNNTDNISANTTTPEPFPPETAGATNGTVEMNNGHNMAEMADMEDEMNNTQGQ